MGCRIGYSSRRLLAGGCDGVRLGMCALFCALRLPSASCQCFPCEMSQSSAGLTDGVASALILKRRDTRKRYILRRTSADILR